MGGKETKVGTRHAMEEKESLYKGCYRRKTDRTFTTILWEKNRRSLCTQI